MIIFVSILQFYDIGSLQEFSSGFAQVHVAQSPSLACAYISASQHMFISLPFQHLQPPISTLFPLHYDAVSALAVYSNALFSACGVSMQTVKDSCKPDHGNKVSTLVSTGSVH